MIRDENYINIQGWMLNRLGLKGNELLVYAIIYGFSQNHESSFTGSIRYLSDFIGCSKRTVLTSLQRLSDMGLILKIERWANNVKYCEYAVVEQGGEIISPVVKNFPKPGEEISSQVVKNFPKGGEKISPNNKSDNKVDTKVINKVGKNSKFTPPEVSKVAEYCAERNNNVDAEAFVDFYTSKNWFVGKTKMVDWKAAVRTWEKRNGSGRKTGRGGVETLPDNQKLHDLDGIF